MKLPEELQLLTHSLAWPTFTQEEVEAIVRDCGNLAPTIVQELLTDIRGRSGIGNELEEIDDEVLDELERTLAGIIEVMILSRYHLEPTK